MSGGGGKRVTIGHWLKAYVHLIWCRGPVDAVHQVMYGEKTIINGPLNGSQSVYVNNLNLFGGTKLDGGVQGYVDIRFGDSGQSVHTKMQSFFSHPIPAFRGFVETFFNDFTFSFSNPQFKSLWMRVTRIRSDWITAGGDWYSGFAQISRTYPDMNVVHALYQVSTDPRFNVRWPISTIDQSTWQAAAAQCYAEGLGISGVVKSEIGEDLQNTLLDIMGGYLKLNRTTGLIELHLMRSNYSVGSLTLLDQDNSALTSFSRALNQSDLTNTVIIKYVDFEAAEAAVIEHNLSGVQQSEGEVPLIETFDLISNETVARIVARRKLRQLSSPLAKMTRKTNAVVWALGKNDLVRVTESLCGWQDVACRIVDIRQVSEIEYEVDLVEDVFGLSSAIYTIDPKPPVNYDPPDVNAPQAVDIVELPHWLVLLSMSTADYNALSPDYGFNIALVARNTLGAYTYRFDLMQSLDAVNYTDVDDSEYAPTAMLSASISKVDTTLSLIAGVDLYDDLLDGIVNPTQQLILYVNSASGEELMAIESYDSDADTLLVRRGALDTVPLAHAAGTRVFILNKAYGSDTTQYMVGDLVNYKILPFSDGAVFELGAATNYTQTMTARAVRPYRPSQFKINNEYYPAQVIGDVVISWVGANRITQTVSINDYTTANVTPEVGTTYNLFVYAGNGTGGTLLVDETGLTTNNYTLNNNDIGLNQQLTIVLQSERDDYISYTSHQHTITRTGLGFGLGERLGQ